MSDVFSTTVRVGPLLRENAPSSRRYGASAGRLFGAVARLEAPDATVFLRGELDLSTAALLQGCVEQLPADVGVLVLDLTQLEFIDCAGLDAVLECAREQASHGGSLSITSPQPAVQRVFELTGLARLTNITDLYASANSGRSGSSGASGVGSVVSGIALQAD